MTHTQNINQIVKVSSHVRSGTHFMMAALFLNFYQGVVKCNRKACFRGHWSRKDWTDKQFYDDMPWKELFGGHAYQVRRNGIYMVRDGRDTLVSMYRMKEFHDVAKPIPSFSVWLRTKLDWKAAPSHPALNDEQMTPPEHWYNTVEPYLRVHPFVMRYELLHYQFDACMSRTCAFFSLVPVHDNPLWKRPELVGHGGWKGKPGEWAYHFDADDLDYFYQYVPMDFKGLWNA